MSVRAFLFFAVATPLVLWAYWPALALMAERWAVEEEYSHGWLVPIFSLYLLFSRRPDSEEEGGSSLAMWIGLVVMSAGGLLWVFESSRYGLSTLGWAGMVTAVAGFCVFAASIVKGVEPEDEGRWLWSIPLIVLAAVMRFADAYFNIEWVGHISMIPLIAGIVVAAGGINVRMWAWPAIGYLVFMIPLPFRVETAMRQPLRQVATAGSTYVLQTIGYPAYAEGNAVMVDEVKLDIVEACSGLSMLMTFFALSVAVAILSDRPMWQRGLIVLSALPIALFSNISRITAQGLLYINSMDDWAGWFHDEGAAWFMVAVALLLLLFELWYLDRLLIVEMKVPMEFGLEPETQREDVAGTPPLPTS